MTDITLSWTDFKDVVNNNHFSIIYSDLYGNYYLYAVGTDFQYSCIINKTGSSDQTDFENNFKASAIKNG